MKIKTCELEKSALNWAVAKSEGYIDNPDSWLYQALETDTEHYYPSTSWSIAGPIIQRERICLDIGHDGVWLACIKQNYEDRSEYLHSGQTALEAAMRCYVSSTLGDEVEIPGERL